MKTVSLGVENFETIIKDCYYVDHSYLIEDIENTAPGSSILFLRPRRFGKSLALSMLKSFYSSEPKRKNELFGSLLISHNGSMMSKESIPVISIKLKDVKENDYPSLLESLSSLIKHEFKKHALEISAASDYQMEIDAILEGKPSETQLKDSLYILSEAIHNGTGKKPLLLIDEYDTPIAYSRSKGYYDEAIGVVRAMFSKALKGNDHIYKAVLTGVMKIAKESLFSDMNNLIVDDGLNNRFREPFAFTEGETRRLLECFGIAADMEEVKSTYGGYVYATGNYLNPWSILSFVACKGVYAPYWTSTASNSQIFEFFQDDLGCLEKLNHLMEDGIIRSVGVNKEFNYAYSSTDYDSFFLLLRAAGYLSIANPISFSSVDLKLPNKEMEEVFAREVLSRFAGSDLSSMIEIRNAFCDGNENALESLIKSNALSAFSYFEFGDEKAYQVMMLTLATLLFKRSVVKSEVNAGEGRCDIMISPKNQGQFGAVIEIKFLKSRTISARLSSSAENALKQIKTNRYVDELMVRDARPIYAYGMSFQGKNVSIKKEKIR